MDIVARIGREPWDMLTQQADNVYQLGNSELSQQNFGRIPIRVKLVYERSTYVGFLLS